MKILIALMGIFFTFSLQAQLDYKALTLYRTYPSSFTVNGVVGYSIPFYKQSDIVFGYVRPSVELQTSGVVNSGILKLDFNPISFVNFYVGVSHHNRNYEKFDTFDCEEVVCSSKLNRKLYGGRIALAYKKLNYVLALKYYDTTIEGEYKGEYVETLGYLLHEGKRSVFMQTEHILAVKLNDELTLGYLGFLGTMRNNKQNTQMHLLFGKKEIWDNWNYTIGLGVFNNRDDAKIGTFLGMLTWAPEKGLPLF